MPGGGSRWNAGKDLSWVPMRVERVAEVTFGQLEKRPLPPRRVVRALAPRPRPRRAAATTSSTSPPGAVRRVRDERARSTRRSSRRPTAGRRRHRRLDARMRARSAVGAVGRDGAGGGRRQRRGGRAERRHRHVGRIGGGTVVVEHLERRAHAGHVPLASVACTSSVQCRPRRTAAAAVGRLGRAASGQRDRLGDRAARGRRPADERRSAGRTRPSRARRSSTRTALSARPGRDRANSSRSSPVVGSTNVSCDGVASSPSVAEPLPA